MTAAATKPGARIAIVAAAACGIAVLSDLVLGAIDSSADSPSDAPAVVRPAPAAARSATGAPSAPATVRLDRLDAATSAAAERAAGRSENSLFDPVDWKPAEAKVVPVAAPAEPPPTPVAPPFPYAYMGALLEDGVRTVFLTSAERLIAVQVGDAVDGAYRVDELTERQLKLTYLPLAQPMVVPLGGRR